MADRAGQPVLCRGYHEAALEAGQRVWLVTASPVELAGIIARRLGFSGALGTLAESVDGIFTGGWSAGCCTVRRRRRR